MMMMLFTTVTSIIMELLNRAEDMMRMMQIKFSWITVRSVCYYVYIGTSIGDK